jgi:hypothetical protein
MSVKKSEKEFHMAPPLKKCKKNKIAFCTYQKTVYNIN